ncbi:MAG TPA: hypothetical protein VGF48_21270 [Thermoanaerobaculia bacterium]|jgi:hypothetical protein
MRLILLTILLILSFSLPGEGRRRAVAASPLADEVTITFVDVTAGSGSEAAIDAGVMRWRKRNATTSRKMFGIRIERSSGEARGTATLRASLESFDPRAKVSINGIELGASPRVIDAQAPIGSVTAYALELEVPRSAAEGTLSSVIRWEVTTN